MLTTVGEAADGVAAVRPLVTSDDLACLYSEHYRDLARLARLLLADDGAAADAVHEAFVRLWLARARLRAGDQVLPYLRTTLVNECRARLRRRSIALRRRPAPDPPAARPDELALLGEERQALVAAIDALSPRQRECIVLRYWLELSEQEIAATLGITAGSVKTHTHRALHALERALEEHP